MINWIMVFCDGKSKTKINLGSLLQELNKTSTPWIRELYSQDHRGFGIKLETKGCMESHLSTMQWVFNLGKVEGIKW